MAAERAVMLVKVGVTYFGEFCYLKSSCMRKKYYCNVFKFFEK